MDSARLPDTKDSTTAAWAPAPGRAASAHSPVTPPYSGPLSNTGSGAGRG
jgi:hypothetical protein